MNWKEDYKRKVSTPEKAIKDIDAIISDKEKELMEV